MFKSQEYIRGISNMEHLFRKHGSGNKRQQRKLVLFENGFANNVLLLLVLFFLLSFQCIGVADCGQVSPSSAAGLGKSISSSSSSGKDGRGGSGSSSVTAAMDDGELLSHQSYHRHHRHSSSGKNLPQSGSSSSTSATYGYQPEYNPLSYYNPDIYYETRHHDRPSREFSARSTSYPAMAVAASVNQVGFAEPEYGGLALATGHGGGHGGHGGHGGGGHGHNEGYGHGHHTTYYKTVNKLDQSSLGLLGLLGLLSLLSNVLLLLTTTARTTTMAMGGMGGRRVKRDTMMLVKVKDEEDLARKSVVERLSCLILPSLNVVGHAKDGRIPLNCTYQEVCKTNKALVQVFGADDGRPVASVLSTAITKLLTNNMEPEKKAYRNHWKNGIFWNRMNEGSEHAIVKKLLTDAGLAGRNRADCELIYPTCHALSDTHPLTGVKKKAPFRLPFLISPEHALSIIMGQSRG